jgi:hypothetical protein
MYNTSSDYTESYVDTGLSDQCAHILSPGIKELCVTDNPDPMVWMALRDGSLVSCTLNIKSQVIAFARHPMRGRVESVAAAPGLDGDVLWLAVERDGTRFVEHLVMEDLVGAAYDESHYADSGVRISLNTPATVIGGLAHLAGMTVTALGDGCLLPPRTVSPEGTVEYDMPVSLVHAGLPVRSAFMPTVPDIPANGASMGKNRRIEKALLRVYESFGGACGVSEDALEVLSYMRYGQYVFGTAPEPFTGDIDLTVSGNIDPDGKLLLVHDEPVPFTLLGLIERIALLEA